MLKIAKGKSNVPIEFIAIFIAFFFLKEATQPGNVELVFNSVFYFSHIIERLRREQRIASFCFSRIIASKKKIIS